MSLPGMAWLNGNRIPIADSFERLEKERPRTMTWKDDADENDRLAKMRIPVTSAYPVWRYEGDWR